MEEKEFNLIDEKWVKVLSNDYSVKEETLKSVLLNAHLYQDLSGEMPTQNVAVFRLLLSVLYTVFYRFDVHGNLSTIVSEEQAIDRWMELWNLKRFPEIPVASYLDTWKDRFWLFHPERPFFQVPEAIEGTKYGAKKLNSELLESNNKKRLFSGYCGEGKDKMDYAMAARCLISLNTYDDSSMKKQRDSDLPSIGVGWSGKTTQIQLHGSNLFESLMLNLVFLKDGKEIWGSQKPCWELERPRMEERAEIEQPDNPAELLTIQSRRIILLRENGKVIGYSEFGGDFFHEKNAFCEQNTLWMKNVDKKTKEISYSPFRYYMNRQFFFNLYSLLNGDNGNRIPGVFKWLRKIIKENPNISLELPMVNLFFVSVIYDEKSCSVADVFSDQYTFKTKIFGEHGEECRNIICEEIGKCVRLRNLVLELAKGISISFGKSVANKRSSLEIHTDEELQFRMDSQFRKFLVSIDPELDDNSLENNIETWRKDLKKIGEEIGEELIRKVKYPFLQPRYMKTSEDKEPRKYNIPLSYNFFQLGMKRLFER